jgi:hypothetical protein
LGVHSYAKAEAPPSDKTGSKMTEPKQKLPWLLVGMAWLAGALGLLATCSTPKPQTPAKPRDLPPAPGPAKSADGAEVQGRRLRAASRTARAQSGELIAASQDLLVQLGEAERRERAVWGRGQ